MMTARLRDGGTAGPGALDGRIAGEVPAAESAGGRPDSQSRSPAVPQSPLGRLVAAELHSASTAFRPDEARLAAGWTYRFVADGQRAEEMAALYRELGFEVAVDAVGEATLPACRDCQLVAALRFRALYTRPC